MMKIHKTTAIILAGGRGKRMNSKVSKQYLLLKEKPILYYSLKVFQESFMDEIILVVPEGEMEYCRKQIVEFYHFTKVIKIVEGGKERYHSVYNALKEIEHSEYVFIHDGARPFVSEEILDRAYKGVTEHSACVVGMPAKDTVKIANADGFAADTPNRDLVWTIQTPQVFSFAIIREAYEKLILSERTNNLAVNITDDAMVAETFLHQKIRLVEGSYSNIKITTPEDLEIAKVLLKS